MLKYRSRRLLSWMLFATASAATASALLLWKALGDAVEPVPIFEQVRDSYRKSDAVLLDRHGAVLQQLTVDQKGRRLNWVALADVSPAMTAATLFAEDRRFYRHAGTDWIGVGAALFDALAGRERGASTLSMQLVSLVLPELRAVGDRKSLAQKWKQIRSARALERSWTKSQILEAYLNLTSFRGELQGLAAASRGLFGKEPHGLNHAESLVLAALVRSPNAATDKVAARARSLGRAMGLPIAPDAIATEARRALRRNYFIEPEADLAPHVARALLKSPSSPDQGASRIRCTLDASLQRFVLDLVRHHLAGLASRNVRDAAALVVENSTGDVLAYVGNTGTSATARFVDGVQARRQAGSTLKPFLYGLAIERQLLTAASLIEDSPLDIAAPGGVYRPRNYDQKFNGVVTARTALASSLNVPAVKTLNLVGTESFREKLQQLGFRDLESADFYGVALALGSADVSLWDLVNAYRTLANNGVWRQIRLEGQRQVLPERRVYSEQAAFIISDILSDRESRTKTFSLASPLSTRFWTAVKTGTSKEMRDNWCVGYSRRYTVGVWVGNFSGAPMWNVSGVTGAAPVWVAVMNWLHRDSSSHRPDPPSGVAAGPVEITELGLNRFEWFIEGTEMTSVDPVALRGSSRITYPVAGTIIALDPDIPADEERVFFESEVADKRLRWALDGEVIGSAAAAVGWSPILGKHTLSLVDPQNRTLDSIDFEVRGGVKR